MIKTYELADAQEGEIQASDEQKTIVVKHTETREETVSIAQLKIVHASILEKIAGLQERADAIVDEMTEIEKNVNITVEDIPSKILEPKK